MDEPDHRERAFEAMYAEHYAPIYRYMLVAVGPDDAEDLAAETFQKAYFALRGGAVTVARPRAWLLTIARRTAVDAHRRRRRRPSEGLGGNEPAGVDLIRARETWIWFASVTRDLPEQARQALYMRYAAGHSTDDIATALGISASGVRSTISRALEVIRRSEEEARR